MGGRFSTRERWLCIAPMPTLNTQKALSGGESRRYAAHNRTVCVHRESMPMPQESLAAVAVKPPPDEAFWPRAERHERASVTAPNAA